MSRGFFAVLATTAVYLAARESFLYSSATSAAPVVSAAPAAPLATGGVSFTVLDDAGAVAKVVPAKPLFHTLSFSYCSS